MQAAAERLGLTCRDEGTITAPALHLHSVPDAGRAAAARKSLVRHERGFARDGELQVEHCRDGHAILPLLDDPLYADIAANALEQKAYEYDSEEARDLLDQLDMGAEVRSE